MLSPITRPHRMPLRTRLLWLFLPLLAASLGGIWLLSESILLSRFDREDQQRLQEGATVLHNRLDFELKRHLDIVRTYAWWDASYDFIQRPNETFEQENLDHEMLDDLGFDFVLFLDDRGHLQLKQWSPPAPDQRVLFGAPSASDQALLEALQQRAIRLGALDFRGRTDHSLSELLLVDNLPTLLVSVPISNNQGSAPAKGAILAGYFLDRERLANLREQMQADLQPMPNIATDSTWKPLRSRSGSTHNQALLSPRRFIGEHVQQVSVQYLSSSGEPQLRFDITKKRLLYIQGEKAINFFLGASLLVALGAFLVGYLALELWVLRRVQRLNREVAEVGRNAHSIRLSDFGNDELGQLAGEMNQMLERLEHSEARDRAILQSMRDGYFEMDVDGVILTVNPALYQLLGQTRADGGGGAGLGEEGEQRTVTTVDHHRLGKVAHQRQVVQGLRGAVHRVDRRSEGKPCLQPLLGHVRHRRHRQADFLGDIADDDPGAAADGDHAEAVAHRIDTPGGEVGDVHQFLGGPGADHRIVAQHGVQHLVVAGQRSGVGQRRAATQGAAPDLVQDHRLAGAMRGLQGGEELPGSVQRQAGEEGAIQLPPA